MSFSEPGAESPEWTWVATRGSAWSAAWALTGLEVVQPRFLMFVGAVMVGLPAFLVAAGKQGTAFDLVLGIALGGFLVVSCVAISTYGRARRFRILLPAGHRLTCRVGPDYFVLRNDDAESTMQFSRYERLDVVGEWVFLRQHARRVRALVPLQLFAPDDLARLRLVILGSPPPADGPAQGQ
jgi:hypothetical protein